MAKGSRTRRRLATARLGLAASSDNDFLAKMRIVLREAKESRIAIRVITKCRLAGWREVERFEDEARQLSLIFGKIIVNKKAGMNRTRPS